MADKQIFISFAASERSLAVALQEIIEQTFEVGVFVSDTTITAGERWDSQIEDYLSSAELLLVLCSPTSIKRQWVNFEYGALSYKLKPESMISICHSGLCGSDLPVSLANSKKLDMHQKDFLSKLYEIIGKSYDHKKSNADVNNHKDSFEKKIRLYINDTKDKEGKKNLVEVCITCSARMIEIRPIATAINEPKKSLPHDEWVIKINRMRAFLADPEAHSVCYVGAAVGVQNCLFDGQDLSVGVRVKASADNYSSGATIGLGMFNTGYALLNMSNYRNIASSDTLQDLFVVQPSFPKRFVKFDENDSVFKALSRAITAKGDKLWKLRLADGREVVATLFINNSRRFPRFEIGIWKYIDIGSDNLTGEQKKQLSSGIVNGFGEDVFLDYRGEDEPQPTSWIWVQNGEIRYWSYPEERMIPRMKPVSYTHLEPKDRPKHAVLVSADCMNTTYGNPVRYTPFASDEKLREDRKKLIPELFSAPARALLSCF